MSVSTVFTIRSLAYHAARALLPLALAAAAAVAPAAEPAQSPLISRAGKVPPPNFMVTLDTSWSMIFPYAPEGAFTVNGYTVKFPGFDSPIMHPSDNRYDRAGNNAAAKAAGNGGAILADPANTNNTYVLQHQMRSPDVNSIYYNPRKLYLPWLRINADDSIDRYPPAVPTKAWFDPNVTSPDNATTRADLTAATANVSAQWCRTVPATAGGNLSCDAASTSRSFAPGLFYLLNSTSVNPNLAASYTLHDINSGTYPKMWSASPGTTDGRTDCNATTGCTQAQERQNFANWFVYHRTRLHMAQASIPESILAMDDKSIRLGWAGIHITSNMVDGVSGDSVLQGVRELTPDVKRGLVSWLRSIKSNNTTSGTSTQPKLAGGTYLRVASIGVGEYFKRIDARNPWANDPGASDGGGLPAANLSCRRSYNMLITDGYYNDASSNAAIVAIGNADAAAGVPYADSWTGRLADIAYKYWNEDLRTDLDNDVVATETDTKASQHLTQFTVGLGVSGTYDQAQWKQIKAKTLTPTWWDATLPTDAAVSPRKIDELLHAALNSRGDFFSVRESSDLVDAMREALGQATAQRGSESGVATAAPTLTAGNRKYIPEYYTSQWTGTIKAYDLDAYGRTVLEDTDDTNNAPLWDASTKVPAHGSRSIYTWDKSAGSVVPFLWASLSTDSKDLLGALKSENLVNYLRGAAPLDAYKEEIYRKRKGPLGDFVNSPPALIKGNVNLGYGADITGGADYAGFYATKTARSGVVFIGGNDGMLHAFQDSDGAEVFAYVPRAVFPKLSQLADKAYGSSANYHQAFVDGPLTEADAFILTKASPSTRVWTNVLLATMGAGARGLVALDVTNTTSFGSNTVLWELEANDDMGFFMSEAQVGVLPGGTAWKVFVPNGYHSPNGVAALMVIDLATGVLEKTLLVGSAGTNGLGGVRLVRNAKREVVAAYAGDLDGKLWRFEFGSADSDSWRVGYNGTPLFVARSATSTTQPITAAPALMLHPNGDGSNIVIVGTGKLMDELDREDASAQTTYGVWDKQLPTASTASSSADAYLASSLRSALVEQTVSVGNKVSTTGAGGKTIKTQYYNVTSNTIDWTTGKLGWYMDLGIEAGQRVIYEPQVVDGYVILSTVAPADDVAGCGPLLTGRAYDFVLYADTGGQVPVAVFDTNRDKAFTAGDELSGGYGKAADGRNTIVHGVGGGGGGGGGGDIIVDPPFPPPLLPPKIISLQHAEGDIYVKLPPKCIPKNECECVEVKPPQCISDDDVQDPPTNIKGRVWKQIINHPQSGL